MVVVGPESWIAELRRGAPTVTMDHVSGLRLSRERADTMFTRLQCMERLMHGLFECYQVVRAVELRGFTPPDLPDDFPTTARPIQFIDSRAQDPRLINRFDWYAINLVRYVELADLVADPHEVKNYRKLVCGNVLTYRHKVAAHFAAHKIDFKHDNDADRELSLMNHLMWDGQRLHTGAISLYVKSSGKAQRSQWNWSWSLTKFHEQSFALRYALALLTGETGTGEDPPAHESTA